MNTLFAMSTPFLSGGQVLLVCCMVGVALYLGIFATKIYINNQRLKIKSDGVQEELRKDAVVEIHQQAKNIRLAGLASVVAVVLIAFGWTQFRNEQVLAEFLPELEEIEKDIPPTAQDQPKLPSALPLLAPPVETNRIDVVDEPKEPKEYSNEIYTIVEEMPRFPGCEGEGGNNDTKHTCAYKKLLKFIYKNMNYPTMAHENGIEGFSVISFIVMEDGSIKDAKISRDPGAGCGKEALRIINMMNTMSKKWRPGKQQGKLVRVRYSVSIEFNLNK